MISPYPGIAPHAVNVLFENGFKARVKLAYLFINKDVVLEFSEACIKIGNRLGLEKRMNADDVLFCGNGLLRSNAFSSQAAGVTNFL